MTVARAMTVQASTKRLPAVDAGKKRGEPVAHLACVMCTPLDPIAEETRARFLNDEQFQGRECYTFETDIRASDVLVVAGVEYAIAAVGQWDAPSWQTPRRLTVLILEADTR